MSPPPSNGSDMCSPEVRGSKAEEAASLQGGIAGKGLRKRRRNGAGWNLDEQCCHRRNSGSESGVGKRRVGVVDGCIVNVKVVIRNRICDFTKSDSDKLYNNMLIETE